MSIDAVMSTLRGRVGRAVYGIAWPPPGESAEATAESVGAEFAFVPDSEDVASAVQSLHAADRAAFVAVMGPVGITAATVGWSGTVKLSVQNPDALKEAMEVAATETIQRLRAAHSAGADAIIIADDLASTNGWLLDPGFVMDVVMPLEHSCGRVIDAVPMVFHSDGDIGPLYPGLAAGCFSAVHIAAGGPDATRAAVAAATAAGLVPIGGIPAVELNGDMSPVIAARIAALAPLGLKMVSDDGGMTGPAQVSALGTVYAMLREGE